MFVVSVKNKLILLISVLFYAGMLLMTCSARKLHEAGLPHVKVSEIGYQLFVDGDGKEWFSAALPKEWYREGRLYAIGGATINNGYRTVARQVDAIELGLENEDFYQVKNGLNAGDSLLYDGMRNSRGLLMADFDNLDLEVEVYDDSTAWISDFRIWYGNGKVYLQDAGSQKLVSFPLSAIQKKNKAVRLVATGELSDIAPYGCGYRLERIEEEWDKIALKMLAQDTDYDLCLNSSGYSKSIAMRDSNVFYPLNDLPGIEEYLDRCFPYIREAATTEDGSIWMLPFSANLYAMLVQEERAAERGLALHDDMTLYEFSELVRRLSEQEQGLFMVYPQEVGDDVLKRYFWHNASVQDGTFLDILENLRVLYRNESLLNPPGNVNQEILLCTVEAFGRYPRYSTREGFSIYSVPKGEAADKNNVTLYYFVVNGKSKYREEALGYLTDLIAYLMRRDDLMIFKDYQAENGSVEERIHELFGNGEVSFAVDEDVYQKDFEDVLRSDRVLEEYVQEVERRLLLYWGE